jgi:hypothetical protein
MRVVVQLGVGEDDSDDISAALQRNFGGAPATHAPAVMAYAITPAPAVMAPAPAPAPVYVAPSAVT